MIASELSIILLGQVLQMMEKQEDIIWIFLMEAIHNSRWEDHCQRWNLNEYLDTAAAKVDCLNRNSFKIDHNE